MKFGDIQLWTDQMLNGIDFLHSNKPQLIHRDLKPANIFINSRHLVIGDLGHAKELLNDVSSGGNSFVSSSNASFGTNNYLAPEASDRKRSSKIDIWSFGCIIYELFKLEKLFNLRNQDKLRMSIIQFDIEKHLLLASNRDKIKAVYLIILKKTLAQNPENRLTARELNQILDVMCIINLLFIV